MKGDCWLYNMENNVWTEKKLKTNDKRRWHQCAHIDNELIIVGGIQTDMRSNHQDSLVNHYYIFFIHLDLKIFFPQALPNTMLIFLTSPKSLLR